MLGCSRPAALALRRIRTANNLRTLLDFCLPCRLIHLSSTPGPDRFRSTDARQAKAQARDVGNGSLAPNTDGSEPMHLLLLLLLLLLTDARPGICHATLGRMEDNGDAEGTRDLGRGTRD